MKPGHIRGWSSGRLRSPTLNARRARAQCRRRCRADLHQPDRARRADRVGAEIAFLDDVGVGQRRIDPPAAVGAPARRRDSGRRGRPAPRLAVVRQPELRAAEVEPRATAIRSAGRRASRSCAWWRSICSASARSPIATSSARAADVGRARSTGAGSSWRGAGRRRRPCPASRARAGRRSFRASAPRPCSSGCDLARPAARPAPTAPPNKPRRRRIRARRASRRRSRNAACAAAQSFMPPRGQPADPGRLRAPFAGRAGAALIGDAARVGVAAEDIINPRHALRGLGARLGRQDRALRMNSASAPAASSTLTNGSSASRSASAAGSPCTGRARAAARRRCGRPMVGRGATIGGRLDRAARDRQPLQLLGLGQVGRLGEQGQDRASSARGRIRGGVTARPWRPASADASGSASMPAAAPPQSPARIAANTPRQSRGIGDGGRDDRRRPAAAYGVGAGGAAAAGCAARPAGDRRQRIVPAAKAGRGAGQQQRSRNSEPHHAFFAPSTATDPSMPAPCPTAAGAASAGGRWRRCARLRPGGPGRARRQAAGRVKARAGRIAEQQQALRAWPGGYGRGRCRRSARARRRRAARRAHGNRPAWRDRRRRRRSRSRRACACASAHASPPSGRPSAHSCGDGSRQAASPARLRRRAAARAARRARSSGSPGSARQPGAEGGKVVGRRSGAAAAADGASALRRRGAARSQSRGFSPTATSTPGLEPPAERAARRSCRTRIDHSAPTHPRPHRPRLTARSRNWQGCDWPKRRRRATKGNRMSDRESMDYDVVIVGAGPAGLRAAIRLKQLAAEAGPRDRRLRARERQRGRRAHPVRRGDRSAGARRADPRLAGPGRAADRAGDREPSIGC